MAAREFVLGILAPFENTANAVGPNDEAFKSQTDAEFALQVAAAVSGAKALSILKTAMGPALAASEAEMGIFGAGSVGAAEGTPLRVLQSSGNTIKSATAKALGLTKEQANRAMHAMKPREGIPAKMVGKIMSNGDYVHPDTGQVLGNLYDYVISNIP